MPKGKAGRPRRNVRAATRAIAATSIAEDNPTADDEVRVEPIQAALNVQPRDEFSQEQLIKISEIVNNAVRSSLSEVATKAARSAVDLVRSAPDQQPTVLATTNSQPILNVVQFLPSAPSSSSIAAATNLHPVFASQSSPSQGIQSAGFTPEIPAAYVRAIQLGEFFYLSKLLPENLLRMSFMNESDGNDVSLVVGPNQELKLKKNNRKMEISNISDWTPAFTTYMKVILEKFPNRAHELINYLDIIQDAARYQKSFTWLIYDRLFRYKASNNKCINWGVRDNELWIRLSTVNPDQLMVDYPMLVNDRIFNNGPSKYVSGGSGAKRDEPCHSFNRGHTCPKFCKFTHRCNKEGCLGEHPGIRCPKFQSPTGTSSGAYSQWGSGFPRGGGNNPGSNPR